MKLQILKNCFLHTRRRFEYILHTNSSKQSRITESSSKQTTARAAAGRPATGGPQAGPRPLQSQSLDSDSTSSAGPAKPSRRLDPAPAEQSAGHGVSDDHWPLLLVRVSAGARAGGITCSLKPGFRHAGGHGVPTTRIRSLSHGQAARRGHGHGPVTDESRSQ